jgi:hypothetical protein
MFDVRGGLEGREGVYVQLGRRRRNIQKGKVGEWLGGFFCERGRRGKDDEKRLKERREKKGERRRKGTRYLKG